MIVRGRLFTSDSTGRARRLAGIMTAAAIASCFGTGVLRPRSPIAQASLGPGVRSFLIDEGAMPELDGGVGWLNSPALSRRELRGKVVLVNFWTYTCINSIRPLPYLRSWAVKYGNSGFVIVGVHSPEFSFEREEKNVEQATRNLNVRFPVAIDSNHEIWDAFHNEYWPAQYLVDAKGRIRYHHFGEGDYEEIELRIQGLLKDNGVKAIVVGRENLAADGIEAPPDWAHSKSPETYLGYRQAENFSSGRVARDSTKAYTAPTRLPLNHWGLAGSWNINGESAVLQDAPGRIVFRFHSRDLHLVMAPPKDGKPSRFLVRLDGAAPGENSGGDISPDGSGTLREPRLYQLIRQKGPIVDRTFEIEFLDPSVHALDFTFG